MSMQDPLADMLTRIRNAQMAGIEQISMNVSKTKAEIAKVLRDEGFVESFEVDGEVKKTLTIELKYLELARLGAAVIACVSRSVG